MAREQIPVLGNEAERMLSEFVAQFYGDPYGFVMAIFPWGEPLLADGSVNPLAKKTGPEDWQRELLEAVGEHIKANGTLISLGLFMQVWRSAIASGHGVGKSAIVAWLILFFMSTRVNVRGVVTASTQHQLEDKTWPELRKWQKLAINGHWFLWSSSSFSFAAYAEEDRKNYRFTAATVSKDNTEAFAGLHNEGRAVVVLFDEASGVEPKVWEVAHGALSDGEAFFAAFGNPTEPEGEFPDCFDKHKDDYSYLRNIDSRSVSHTNKDAIRASIKILGGEDSDAVKVRWRGIFPSQSYNGFISVDGVNDAQNRDTPPDFGAGLIMAVDVARFGNDESVIGYRQGRDAFSRPYRTFKHLSLVKLAEIVAMEANNTRPDAIVIESTGPGAGVIDILRDKNFKIVEVHPGARANAHEHYMNRRAEYWALMRDWLYEEGRITDDPELFRQLTTIQYTLDRHEQRILLESKESMKSRGLPSPDRADTLALTFAVSIARRDRNKDFTSKRSRQAIVDENPLGI